MAGKTYQSCLVPFEKEIIALRRKKPPTPYAKIAEYMQEKHQIKVCRETIFSFIKIRAKGYKTCKYAWNIESTDNEDQPTTEAPSLSKQTVSEVQETPKQSVTETPKPKTVTEQNQKPEWTFKMPWSDVYNLTRMSDEEAAERNKRIEEKRKRLMEEQLKKENQ